MLKNCEECNKVFAHPSRSLCEECFQREQKDFTAVKDFLQKNPGASVATVALETEVDLEKIYEYIREGRLSIVPHDAVLQCEICGAKITSGRVCTQCRTEFRKSSYTPPETKQKEESKGSRIHYLDQIKDRR